MDNVAVADMSKANVLSIENRKAKIPNLTELAKADPDIKEMIKLIVQYDLRDKAVELFRKKLSSVKTPRWRN